MDRNLQAKENFKKKIGKRILIFGASAHKTTGNGKLIYHMAKGFQAAGHQVFCMGMDYNSQQIYYDGIPIIPSFSCEHCSSMNEGSPERVQKIADFINFYRPQMDYFICVGDPYQFQQKGIGLINFNQIKTILYSTIDSVGLFCNQDLNDKGLPDYLKQCDKIVSTAKFGQDVLKNWGISSDMIYEAINTDLYCPVTKEKKEELRKARRLPVDAFIMYSSGRNILRKRHFDTIDAASKLISETENSYLILNIPSYGKNKKGQPMYPDSLNPYDFVRTVMKKKYGHDYVDEGRIIFLERGDLGSNAISEKNNAELYQLSDVLVMSTSAEGFNLTPVEANSCGVPAIVPSNSMASEILGIKPTENQPLDLSSFSFAEGGLLTKCDIDLWQDFGLKQRITSPNRTYEALRLLYYSPICKSQNGEEYFLRKTQIMYNKDQLAREIIGREEFGRTGRNHVLKNFTLNQFHYNWNNLLKTVEKRKADAGFLSLKEEKNGK
jgi:glycosyltransferase involved in cell wall biosynthesis